MELLLFCIATTFSPGPNNLLLFCSGLNHGIRPSIPHALGILAGFSLMLAAVYFFQDITLNSFPDLILPLKIAGILYLFYFLWKIAQPLTRNMPNLPPMTFHRASLFQVSNPKAWLMSLSATSIFAKDTQSFFILLFSYTVIGIINSLFWLLTGQLTKRNIRSKRALRYINYTAIALLLTSLFLVIAGELSYSLGDAIFPSTTTD